MNQTLKSVGKKILKALAQLAILIVMAFAIQIVVEGAWIFGLPSSDKVQSVSIAYPTE